MLYETGLRLFLKGNPVLLLIGCSLEASHPFNSFYSCWNLHGHGHWQGNCANYEVDVSFSIPSVCVREIGACSLRSDLLAQHAFWCLVEGLVPHADILPWYARRCLQIDNRSFIIFLKQQNIFIHFLAI